ncbi:recombinase family protein [Mycobacterium kubicae]|uniref:recombinase family protein n=1 Tax=Mycobacterium kubicae TaxID=120959 RepID=UPI0021018A86|nr:recombinase family protein [Mycobacterium kubicae]
MREAYAAVLAGASLGDVCRMWNDAGALTQRWVKPKNADGQTIRDAQPVVERRKWTQPQVSNFLRKPRNAGLRDHNGVVVGKGTWPALVDEDTWRAVRAGSARTGTGPQDGAPPPVNRRAAMRQGRLRRLPVRDADPRQTNHLRVQDVPRGVGAR